MSSHRDLLIRYNYLLEKLRFLQVRNCTLENMSCGDVTLTINTNPFLSVEAGTVLDILISNTENTSVGEIIGSAVVVADSLININTEQVAELPAETELNITVEVDGVETGEWDEATQTWNVGEVLAPALVTLDGEPFFTAHAGTTTDVTLQDEQGNPVEPIGVDGNAIVVESLSTPGWARSSEWLPMPDITSTDDEIVALWAVFEEPGANNFACFSIFSSNGFFEVDHGDGSGWLSFANGTSFYEYDYTNTNLHASSLPYKQAIIKIRATSGGVLNAFNFNVITVSDQQVQTRYNHNFLELKISMPSADSGTSMTLPQSGRRANLLEHIEILNIGNLTSFSGAFQNNRNLIKVTISADTSNVTNLSSAFRECSRLIYLPEMDTSNVTTMEAICRNCASLIEIPSYDFSNVTTFLNAFVDCRALVKTPVFDLSSCTTIQGMFQDCHELEKVELINSTSSLTNVIAAFARCISLQEVSHFNTASVQSFRDTFNGCLSLKNIPNFDLSSVTDMSFVFLNAIALRNIPNFNTVNQLTFPTGTNSFTSSTNIVWIDMNFRNTVAINSCALNREALVHIFNNLLDRTGLASANINISGNPGAISDANGGLTTAERAIATSKNWTITG